MIENDKLSSSALVDEDYFVKIYRKLEAGLNPEIEVGRFLTEVAGFANTPALLGSVELIEGEQRSAIAIVYAFVMNQGDAWTVSAAYLDRFVEEQRLLSSARTSRKTRSRFPICATCRRPDGVSPRCTSRWRAARICPTSRPLPSRRKISQLWIDDVMACAERVFDRLRHPRKTLARPNARWSTSCWRSRPRLPDRLRALLPRDIDCLNIRHHGNLHLGQLLIVKDDIFITDFEGAPSRSIAERRRKAPAARDVARPDSLHRLLDDRHAGARAEGHTGRARQARRGPGGWRERATEALPDRLQRNHRTPALAVPGGYGRKAPQLLPA